MLLTSHLGHMLEKQNTQHGSPAPRWPSIHVHPNQAAQAPLTRSRSSYGGWKGSPRRTVRRTGDWQERHWSSTTELQGRLQKRHKGPGDQHAALGGPRIKPLHVEKHPHQTTERGRRETEYCSRGISNVYQLINFLRSQNSSTVYFIRKQLTRK